MEAPLNEPKWEDKLAMTNAKSFIYKKLYKLAVKLKPIAVKLCSFETRQRIKKGLLKTAFPIHKNDTWESSKDVLTGVNLVGYSRAEMGIGESCRIAAKSMNAAEIPFGILNFIGTNSARMSDHSWVHSEISHPQYNINVFHINAEQMTEVYAHYHNTIFDGRYNIGYWHWELPDFPDEWRDNFSLMDEIWVPSTFVADSIAMKSPVPVVKIPHSIEVEIEVSRDRTYFNLPDGTFLFLTMYDVKSYQERKNPKASIEAFKGAFSPDDMNVGLVIKVNSAESDSTEMKVLQQLIGDYNNIYLIKEILTRNDTNALISVVNCYVSLHRSEGFGLGLAEAMYLGKPVIGTNWSSNTDFMNSSNSCPVNYSMIKLEADHGPYKAYQFWADPDIRHASEYMSRLVEDRGYYEKIAVSGELFIKKYHSPAYIGDMIRKRIEQIQLWKFGG